MLKWALIFALIAIVAGVFGFTGIAAGAAAMPVKPNTPATMAISAKIKAHFNMTGPVLGGSTHCRVHRLASVCLSVRKQ